MRVFLALFIIVPIIEMLVLIRVGGLIGALPTVALVILTAIIGLSLIRVQGLQTLMNAQQKMALGELPAKELVDGICLAIGGVLLLTPGFVTDSLGFMLLIPGLRYLLLANFIKPTLHRSAGARRAKSESGRTIEGESWRE